MFDKFEVDDIVFISDRSRRDQHHDTPHRKTCIGFGFPHEVGRKPFCSSPTIELTWVAILIVFLIYLSMSEQYQVAFLGKNDSKTAPPVSAFLIDRGVPEEDYLLLANGVAAANNKFHQKIGPMLLACLITACICAPCGAMALHKIRQDENDSVVRAFNDKNRARQIEASVNGIGDKLSLSFTVQQGGAPPQVVMGAPDSADTGPSPASALEQLKDMLDKQLISQDEFDVKKTEILSRL